MRTAEDAQTDGSQCHEQRDHRQERDQKLGFHSRGNARHKRDNRRTQPNQSTGGVAERSEAQTGDGSPLQGRLARSQEVRPKVLM